MLGMNKHQQHIIDMAFHNKANFMRYITVLERRLESCLQEEAYLRQLIEQTKKYHKDLLDITDLPTGDSY